MATIVPFKLAGVYGSKAKRTPDNKFWMAPDDWAGLCHQLSLVSVQPNPDWSYDTLCHMLAYADRQNHP